MALYRAEIGNALHRRFRQQQRFKRPGGPVGHHRQPVFGVHHDAFASGQFALRIVQQQRGGMFLKILVLQAIFALGLVRQKTVGPDLPMRVRVGAAHRRAFVFEQLHLRVLPAQLIGLRLPVATTCSSAGSVNSGRVLL